MSTACCLSLLILLGAFVSASALIVRKSPAKIVIGETREGEDILKVDIHADGEVHQLRLKPANNIWAKDAKFFTVKTDKHGNTKFEKSDHEVMSESYRIYQDDEASAVLGIDGQKVNGYIGHLITIKNEDNKHYLYHSDEPDKNIYKNDYLKFPIVNRFNASENANENSTTPPIIDVDRQSGPLTVDVMIFIDSVLTEYFGSQIGNYYSSFWTAVNQRFSTITYPTKFQIRVVGGYILQSSSDEPFIMNNLYSNTNYVHENVLFDFGVWMAENLNDFLSYDVAFLHTGRDMYDSDGYTGLSGIAYLSSACPYYGNFYTPNGEIYSQAVGIGEDWDLAITVSNAAHEVAHTLGAPHDGEDDATSCPESTGYIMAPSSSSTAYKNMFSRCSAYTMAAYAQTSRGRSCLN